MIVVVFDWDDTLMSSSYISRMKGQAINLPTLAKSILDTLLLCRKYGNKVYIITNAQKAWVEHCAHNYLPGCELLCDKFDVISTVDNGYNSTEFPFWKTNAFADTLRPLFENGEKHQLLSFGDCPYDRDAALRIASSFKNVTVKNCKFCSRPSLEQLIRQQFLVRNCLDYLFNHKGHLDLMLTITLVQSSKSITQSSSSCCRGDAKTEDSTWEDETMFDLEI